MSSLILIKSPILLLKHNKSKVLFFFCGVYFFLTFVPVAGIAQEPDKQIDSLLWKEISALVYLDSITITPQSEELDLDAFIKYMLEDESFYQAFRNLRFFEHNMDHKIQFYNKRDKEIASYIGTHSQSLNGTCRTMSIGNHTVDGKYYKRKKEYNFYTSKVIDRVFYTQGVVCEDSTYNKQYVPKNQFEKNIENLKVLIFRPGQEADVMFIGNKLNIFSEEMRKYYDYSLSIIPYNHEKAYIFEIALKPAHDFISSSTVVHKMVTYFDMNNLQVLGRNYELATKNGLYSFELDITVDLTKIKSKYLPNEVGYHGYWKIIGKKPEFCHFNFKFKNYKKGS